MFEKQLLRLPAKLSCVSVLPSGGALRQLPQCVRRQTLDRAARAAQEPIERLLASSWLSFARTGDRAQYETAYFARRRRLNDLVCGLLLQKNPQWLKEAIDTVWCICEESAWQVPAHNAYQRDAPRLPWPDIDRPVLDLFAAETGALLACTAAALAEELPQEVRARIQKEVERRILTPYFTESFWWMGDCNTPLNNWTPWCTQNVLLCAFALHFDEAVQRKAIARAAHSLDCFLQEYGEDGSCSEGAQYYGHAALCLFGCLLLLCRAAPGVFDTLWREKKIVNMAAFVQHMHISGPYYFNFADCSPLAGRRGAREYLFALRTGNEEMASFAARDWKASLAEPPQEEGAASINLWHRLLELEYAAAMTARAAQPENCPAPQPDDRYESSGVYLARRGPWSLAVKGGNNADSHNHNDVGSIILYRGGLPFFIDLGVETYSRKTFSPQRYEIWTMQSSWHNLPAFDGIMQHDGAQYGARNIKVLEEGGAFYSEMELAAAWPPEANLHSFRRTVTLSERGLRICDRCAGSYKQAELYLLVREKPEPLGAERVAVGTLGELHISGAAGPIRIEAVPITDAKLRSAWPDTIYRIAVPFASELTVDAL